jgi:hypothetical protein
VRAGGAGGAVEAARVGVVDAPQKAHGDEV